MWICVYAVRGQRGLQHIFLNLLLVQEVARNSKFCLSGGSQFYQVSNQCLCVFTLRFCVSESRQERISRALCLHCLFPVWLFGSLRGKRRRSQRPIKHKHRTMDDGRRRICAKVPVLGYLCWCHPRTTEQDTVWKFVLLLHINTQWGGQIITSDFI